MKFSLFVEGVLEGRVLSHLLDKWIFQSLSCTPEIAVPSNFEDCGRFVKEIGQSARGHLSSPECHDTIIGIGLLDLKGPEAHNFYPENCRTVEERYSWGVKEIESRVAHPKFHMYFAVHEFEAWLLSQPQIFPVPTEVQERLLADNTAPEDINFDEPPAARIERVYREAVHAGRLTRHYRKISMGIPLFHSLDLNIAREKCPYLRRMLDEILELARAAM